MAVYVVSYDLRKPGRDYQPLWDRLAAWKAVRGLQSLWFIHTNSSAAQLRGDLVGYIDANDGLFVGTLSGETAWQKLQSPSGQFLKDRFE